MKFIACLLLCLAVWAACANAQAGDGFSAEIGNIPFKDIIYGPLEAVIDAQVQAGMTSTNFIREMGFEPEPEETTDGRQLRRVATVDFVYETFDVATNETNIARMELPFLLMLPIPYIEMESMEIHFSVQLTSLQETSSNVNTEWGHTSSGKRGGWFSRSKWSSSYSSQSSTKITGSEKREYRLDVIVSASQPAIPRGMDRILDLFEQLVQQNLPVAV